MRFLDDNENFQLVSSYVLRKWFVSTIHRQSSAPVPSAPWYYETMVWGYDWETRERTHEFFLQEDSGSHWKHALEDHARICAGIIENGGIPEGEKDA